MAYKHAQLAAEKTSKKMERLAQKETEQQRQLDQQRLAVESGEHEMTPSEERQIQNVAGFGIKKPRLTGADEAVIMELAGMLPQAKIGERIGVSQSTVSRHLRKTAPNRRKTGRHFKLTREMLFAAARFQFIFNTTSLQRTCAFIGLSYGANVHPRIMSRHFKRTAGFRLGDFRRFPRDRNSERAIQDRFHYATDKFGQNTLYEAVYFDEMKLSRCTKRKAWSIDAIDNGGAACETEYNF